MEKHQEKRKGLHLVLIDLEKVHNNVPNKIYGVV